MASIAILQSDLIAPCAIMVSMATPSVFAFTSSPRSHRSIGKFLAGSTGFCGIFIGVSFSDPSIGFAGFTIGVAVLCAALALLAWIRIRRTYRRDHEAHYCYRCGQMQTPGEVPTVCPECGSKTFYRIPRNPDAMDFILAFTENEEIVRAGKATTLATLPRALLLAAILFPIALVCVSVGRAMNHTGFWLLIAGMWVLAAFTGANLVTLGVRSPADKETP